MIILETDEVRQQDGTFLGDQVSPLRKEEKASVMEGLGALHSRWREW